MKKNEKTYYLYHIPGIKVGMTCNIYNRVIKGQGYKPGEFDIITSSKDKDVIELLESRYQDQFGYKKDKNSYDNSVNSNINNKSKKSMKLNVTDQTVTFPVPLLALRETLNQNMGMSFSTPHGSYVIDPISIDFIVENARVSMFDNNRSYVYNKVLTQLNKPVVTNMKDASGNSFVAQSPAHIHPTHAHNVYDLIRTWAEDRGIYSSGDSKTQYVKLMEEGGELARALLKKDKPEIIDAIGDMVVVLTNLAALEGLKLEDCVTSAYTVIKSRQGKMENGTFVKQTL